METRVLSRAAACLAAFVALLLAGGCRSHATRGEAGSTSAESVAATDRLAVARTLFYRAVEGDAEALRACGDALRECDGDAAKALAYRGGCTMLEAARAPLPWDKGRLARQGLTMLDDAVARSPQDPEVRFVRGMTSYHLPRFFGRERVAADDLATVAGGAEEAVATGHLDPAIAAAALFHFGVLLERRGDRSAALAAWRRSVAIGPTTRAGTAAGRAMRKHGQSNIRRHPADEQDTLDLGALFTVGTARSTVFHRTCDI